MMGLLSSLGARTIRFVWFIAKDTMCLVMNEVDLRIHNDPVQLKRNASFCCLSISPETWYGSATEGGSCIFLVYNIKLQLPPSVAIP